MPKNVDSTPTPSSKTSDFGQLMLPAPSGSRWIQGNSGKSGAAGQPQSTDRELEAYLKRLLGSLPERKIQDTRGADGQYEGRVSDWILPPLLENNLRQQPDVLSRAIEAVQEALTPVEPAVLTGELSKLMITMRVGHLRGENIEAWLAIMTDELARYPQDVVLATCRGWLRTEQFLPTVAELRDQANEYVRSRWLLYKALKRLGIA